MARIPRMARTPRMARWLADYVCFYYILQIIFKQVLWSRFSTQVRYYFIQIVMCFISVIRLDFV